MASLDLLPSRTVCVPGHQRTRITDRLSHSLGRRATALVPRRCSATASARGPAPARWRADWARIRTGPADAAAPGARERAASRIPRGGSRSNGRIVPNPYPMFPPHARHRMQGRAFYTAPAYGSSTRAYGRLRAGRGRHSSGLKPTCAAWPRAARHPPHRRPGPAPRLLGARHRMTVTGEVWIVVPAEYEIVAPGPPALPSRPQAPPSSPWPSEPTTRRSTPRAHTSRCGRTTSPPTTWPPRCAHVSERARPAPNGAPTSTAPPYRQTC